MTLRAPDERCRRGELLLSMLPGVSLPPLLPPPRMASLLMPQKPGFPWRGFAFLLTDSSQWAYRRLPGERESYNPRNLAVLLYFLPEGLISFSQDANQPCSTAAWKTDSLLFLNEKRDVPPDTNFEGPTCWHDSSALETRCVASGVQETWEFYWTSKSFASSSFP